MQIDVNGAWTSTTESWKAHEVQENTESITSLNELQDLQRCEQTDQTGNRTPRCIHLDMLGIKLGVMHA